MCILGSWVAVIVYTLAVDPRGGRSKNGPKIIFKHFLSNFESNFKQFFNGFLIKLDITIEFAIKNSIDSWIQNEFL